MYGTLTNKPLKQKTIIRFFEKCINIITLILTVHICNNSIIIVFIVFFQIYTNILSTLFSSYKIKSDLFLKFKLKNPACIILNQI